MSSSWLTTQKMWLCVDTWLVSSCSVDWFDLIPINSSLSASILAKQLIRVTRRSSRATVIICVMCVFSVPSLSLNCDRAHLRCANTLIRPCAENRISPQRTVLPYCRTHVPSIRMYSKMTLRVHVQCLKRLLLVSPILDKREVAGWKGPTPVLQVRPRRRQS